MKKKNVLALGEILFDVIDGEYKLGGAPFNVAAHLAKLGNNSYILSAVGNDELGEKIRDEVAAIGVNTDFLLNHPTRPTGTVTVSFNDGEPEYDIVEEVAYDDLSVDLEALLAIDWDIIIFGSLAQRTEGNRALYAEILEKTDADWVYFDANLRGDYYDKNIIETSLQYANIGKFNKDEIYELSELLFEESSSAIEFGHLLKVKFGIELCVFTYGSEGSKGYYNNSIYNQAIEPIEAVDTVGAGDAFTAAFLHSWSQAQNVAKGLERGSILGAYVAGSMGAIPEYSDKIKSVFGLED
ncbi:carbohydrate kinase family protein [Membranihabitans marinus]|uniref:carbohydrate kinase family protein n=1 Tax=Membranihabitans marinus TaxID=1227546 RepID=UPI001F360991|nr:carbohydrate kinase [Membranihabitans marinus]